MKFNFLTHFCPFLDWFHKYDLERFRSDLIGGLTVALVLVPQSMAYAQLAGLPAYYGLYAAFLPPVMAALFGSSRQLATGPVAVVSLMTATALEPLATAGSEQYIAYAILLALLVGIFQFLLGVLRLGLVVNFLSHPVISGFTTAAAIIIATSQLSKLFGVYVDSAEHHYETIYNVLISAIAYTHWPTLGLASLAFAIMFFLRRLMPRIPNVLIAVVITTSISWATGFEKNDCIEINQIESRETQELIAAFNNSYRLQHEKANHRVMLMHRADSVESKNGSRSLAFLKISHELAQINMELEDIQAAIRRHRMMLRQMFFVQSDSDGTKNKYIHFEAVENSKQSGIIWRIKVGYNVIETDSLILTGGGAVVGNIPQGLPKFQLPFFNISTALTLFPMAMIISLLGFMEAISIAKAMAAKTGQRLNPNQELVGQGIANILGSFARSYAVSGSFSRSAVNIQAGAVTGLSSVISGMIVMIVLLFLTPLLYYLPQSVLAAIIMMAVVGLINFKSFIHAWRAQKYDGIIGICSFIGTLVFAPHLDRGILIGVVLSLLLYLLRNMKPVLAMLSLYSDGAFRNRTRFDLPQCCHIAVIRYAGSLFFANVSYLEDRVLETVRNMPKLKRVHIVGNGINELDASGVDMLETLIERLKGSNLSLSFSGLNDSVYDTMRRTGLLAQIGKENCFQNTAHAINNIWEKAHDNSSEKNCPLKYMPTMKLEVDEKIKSKMQKRFGRKND
ncbi:MAG: SulP family inorganic anion transporter [Candidatus Zixiibacteriota bacterium]